MGGGWSRRQQDSSLLVLPWASAVLLPTFSERAAPIKK